MRDLDESLSVALHASDIAWPIVLAMCIALMILPFAFLLVGRGEDEPHDAPG